MINKILLFTLLSFLSFNFSFAQTYVNVSAIGANDGTSWENAYNSLDVALASTSTGDLWIVAGTYRHDGLAPDSFRTFLVSSEINLYGGFSGTETSVDQRDLDNNVTLLTADYNGDDIATNFDTLRSDNSFHVVTVDSLLASPVIFDGITISGGNTNNNTAGAQYSTRGGGIYSWSTIEVNQCRFIDNYATAGASIFIDPLPGGGNGSTMTNNLFTKNRASARGAGTYFFNLSDILIDGNRFIENETARGCIYPFRSDNITISNNIFDGNVGVADDVFTTGIFDFRSTNVTVDNCEFRNGLAANATSIYFDADTTLAVSVDNLVITNCLFDNNTATGSVAAGIYLWQGAGVRIEHCTFSNNTAPSGGVIYQDGREQVIKEGNVVFKDCIFSNNTTTDVGGAFRAFNASTTFENCEFEENLASGGASLYSNGDRGKEVIINNCEFRENESSGFGQASLFGDNSNIKITNSSFSANKVQEGGSAIITGFLANTVIDSCTFDKNEAGRGAVFVQNDSTVVHISNSTFSGNSAATNGGALYQLSGAKITVSNCEFTANMAEGGGAVTSVERDDDLIPGEIFINNSKFLFNSATGQGGALNIIGTDATITNSVINNNFNLGGISGGGISGNASDSSDVVNIRLINCTVVDNEGPVGAGIGLYTSDIESSVVLTLQNTILDNEGSNYEIEAGTPTVVSLGGNVITDNTLDDILDVDKQDKVSIDQDIFVDPSEQDFHLVDGSPAINIGQLPAPEFDIEGNARVNAPDAGSYEYQLDVSVKETLILNDNQLKVTPNPVVESFNLKLDNQWTGDVNIRLFNTNGQLMNTWDVRKSEGLMIKNISISDLAPGIYDLLVGNGKEVVTTRVVKIQ